MPDRLATSHGQRGDDNDSSQGLPEAKRDRRSDRAKPIAKLVTVTPGSLGDYALRYLQDLQMRNYSRHTIRGTRYALRGFLVWCEERTMTDPLEVSLQTLRRYQSHLFHYRKNDGRRLSFVSQFGRLGAVRRLFTWMTEQGHLDENPGARLHLPRTDRRLPKALSAEEAEAILAQPDVTTPRGLRDRAIMETFYATGLRRSELEQLAIADLDFSAGLLTVRLGKGKKDRLLPLSERASAWLEKYIQEIRSEQVLGVLEDDVVFVSSKGKALQGGQIGKLVRQYVQASGIGKEGSCHLFRHTMATLMLEGGADIRYIQKMLGHATLQSTEIYTHVAIRKLKEVHAATHPGAKLQRRHREPGPGNDDPPQEETASTEEELLATLAAEDAEEED